MHLDLFSLPIFCGFHIVHQTVFLSYCFVSSEYCFLIFHIICILYYFFCNVVFVLSCNWSSLDVLKHINKWTEYAVESVVVQKTLKIIKDYSTFTFNHSFKVGPWGSYHTATKYWNKNVQAGHYVSSQAFLPILQNTQTSTKALQHRKTHIQHSTATLLQCSMTRAQCLPMLQMYQNAT